MAKIEGYPLSPQQERIFALSRGSDDLITRCAIRITGPLDTATLAASIRKLGERHEILRNSFRRIEGLRVPVQHVTAELPSLEITVARPANPLEPAFGLEDGHVFLTRLATLPDGAQLLEIVLPAACADGPSLNRFIHELAALYEGAEPASDGELVQYADYAAWRRELLAGAAPENAAFWREQGLEEASALRLPFQVNGARGPIRTEAVPFSKALQARLAAVAAESGISETHFMFAAWGALLARMSGRDCVALGRRFSGRTQAGLDTAIGPYEMSLPSRCDLTAAPTLRTLAAQAAQTHRAAFDRQDLFDCPSSIAFTAGFALHELPAPEGSSVRFEVVEHYAQSDRTAIELAVLRHQGLLEAKLHYDIAAFPDGSTHWIPERFSSLLAAALATPDSPLATLPAAGEIEQATLLALNGPVEPNPRCIHELIEEQVQRRPTAVAISHSTISVTYQELDNTAAGVARLLAAHGVGRESVVGVCMERSIEATAAVLGVLKAGAAWTPLDPHQPEARLAALLKQCGVEVVVTRERFVDSIPIDFEGVVLGVDAAEIWETTVDAPRVDRATPSDAAYVIHTSGSTGAPKGVLGSHAPVVNYFDYLRDTYRLGPTDIVLQLAGLPFDAWMRDTLAPLACGAKIVVSLAADRGDPQLFFHRIIENNVTAILCAVPQLMETWLDTLIDRSCRTNSVRLVLLSGEELRPRVCAKLRAVFGADVVIVNQYGPTECTMTSTFHPVPADHGDCPVPIGRPIPNAEALVLDEHAQLAPFGVEGDIYIGGAGLTRGYFGEPALTAAAFVPHPFSLRPGARVYRTGDRGVRLICGKLHCLGRRDHQVKIRGNRVEPAEVEAVLLRHYAVQSCVVTARESAPGDNRLIAYIVPKPLFAPNVRGRRRHRLPNELAVVHQNQPETDFMYQEIFEEEVYLQLGLRLPENACVFDVGANIGLFTLWAHLKSRGARIYAFEPAPPLFELLSANAALYGAGAKLFQCGLSDHCGAERFTFYPRSSGMSSFYADEREEREVLRAIMENQQAQGMEGMQEVMENVGALLDQRFRGETYMCAVRTLSDVLRQHPVERIDLLKIDAQKAELEVLEGIAEHDWSKIGQVVLEVHDTGGRLDYIEQLLRSRGFHCAIEQSGMFAGSVLNYVYASRERNGSPRVAHGRIRSVRPPLPLGAHGIVTVSDLRLPIEASLPPYMVPSMFVLLDELPLTANGKIERKALPSPEEVAFGARSTPPSTELEKRIANVWTEVLGLEAVGVDDDFFEIGGHSILAIRLAAKLSEAIGKEVPLMTIFEAPTVAALAAKVQQAGDRSLKALDTPPPTSGLSEAVNEST